MRHASSGMRDQFPMQGWTNHVNMHHASSGMRGQFPMQGRMNHVNNDMRVRSSQQERKVYVTPAMRVLVADPFQA